MDLQGRTVEQELARLGTSALGIVTRVELLAAGITATQIRDRIRKGLLIPEYRGVYRVGHCAPSTEAGYMAAVKACGEGAVLHHRAAAFHLGIRRCSPPPPEVATLTERCIEGITTRRVRRLDRRDITIWRAIPTTNVPRTLVDLAADETEDDLARLCHEAGIRHGTTPAHVDAVLARRPTAPGAAKLKRVLRGDVHVTLSKLERAFLQLLGAAGLPLPQTNRRVGLHRVDCRWPEYELIVELDGYTYHHSRHAWEADRRRERLARARGDEYRRYTYGDVFEDPALMLAELHALLSRGDNTAAGAPPPSRAYSRGI
jgi:very-short-patch-repair endonuclease